KIYVSDVLRGDVEEGTMVDVLLPGPVDSNVNVSETTISSQVAVGQRGVFMPALYNENTTHEQSGNVLFLLDLAQYGFLDGERWMFLQSSEGLIYNKEAYPSLENTKDLDEAKEVIKSKIE